MLTPLDIHNKEFTKGMRGYKMEEVDGFLDEVIRNYESLFRENHDLKERVKRMEEEVARSKELGTSLQKTMLMAQKLVDEETIRAKKEGELIQWEAQKKGQQLIQEAQNQVLSVNKEIERLKLYEKQLYLKHKGFLEFQMELLDGYKENSQLPALDEVLTPAQEGTPIKTGREERRESLAVTANMPSMNQVKASAAAQPQTQAESQIQFEPQIQAQTQHEPAEMSLQEMIEAYEKEQKNAAAASEGGARPEVVLGGEGNHGDEAGGQGSMDQVFLMAQKMEEALKTLDQIYGKENPAEEKNEAKAEA